MYCLAPNVGFHQATFRPIRPLRFSLPQVAANHDDDDGEGKAADDDDDEILPHILATWEESSSSSSSSSEEEEKAEDDDDDDDEIPPRTRATWQESSSSSSSSSEKDGDDDDDEIPPHIRATWEESSSSSSSSSEEEDEGMEDILPEEEERIAALRRKVLESKGRGLGDVSSLGGKTGADLIRGEKLGEGGYGSVHKLALQEGPLKAAVMEVTDGRGLALKQSLKVLRRKLRRSNM